MKYLFRKWFAELLLSTLAFILILGYFSLVTDDYAYFMGALAAKQFSDFAYFDVHFQGYMVVRELYRLLYYLMPAVNWHFIYAIFFEWISLAVLLYTLRTIVGRHLSKAAVLGLQLLFIAVFIENLSFVSHTRVSILFCGLALIHFAFAKRQSTTGYWLNALLFALGLLLRSESAMGTLLLVSMGLFIYSRSIGQVVQRLWLPGAMVAAFITVFVIDLKTTQVYVKRVEPEIEYKMMARRVVPLSALKTAQDSVKHDAAVVGMWFDTEQMSPEYLRSLILPGIDLSRTHAMKVLQHLGQHYSYYIFMPVAVILMLLLSLWWPEQRALRTGRIALFAAGTFTLLYALDYNGFLVEHRHFLNLNLAALMVMCIYFFDNRITLTNHSTQLITGAAFLLLAGSVALTVQRYKTENNEVDRRTNDMMTIMQQFEKHYKGQVVVSTIDCRFIFDQRFTVYNHMYNQNTYLMFDWFTFGLTPRYVDYMSRQCGCNANNPVQVFTWLARKKALYFSVPERFELTERYLRTVHGLRVKFINPVNLNTLGGVQTFESQNCELRTVTLATD